jgi:negative regulator of flagellin synthesis FlgM
MQIRPTNNLQSTQSVQLQPRNTTEKTSHSLPVDQVEISAEARLMSAQSADASRADRIADIRTQIASGQYETPEKLQMAVSRMFEEYA